MARTRVTGVPIAGREDVGPSTEVLMDPEGAASDTSSSGRSAIAEIQQFLEERAEV